MPAQGTALGIGSRVENSVENSNALKGQNRFVVKNLVSPFQGWADFHSDQIPRALPWAILFGPFGAAEKRNTKSSEPGRLDFSETDHPAIPPRHRPHRCRGSFLFAVTVAVSATTIALPDSLPRNDRHNR